MKKLILVLMVGMLLSLVVFAASSVHSYELSVIDGITGDYYIWGDSVFIEGSAANPDTTFITNFFEISDYTEKVLQIMNSTGLTDSVEVAYQALAQKSDTLAEGALRNWVVKDTILQGAITTILDFSTELKGFPLARLRFISIDADSKDSDEGFQVRFLANNPNKW